MTTLQPGQNKAISKNNLELNIQFSSNKIERENIDVSAYLLAENKQVRGDHDFIFYNQPESDTGAVKLSEISGGYSFAIDLMKIPSDVIRIPIAIVIHSEHNFSQVDTLSIQSDGEIEFSPKTESMTEKALILGEVYNHKGTWKFKASGMGFNGGLGPLATSYGVDVEDEPENSPESHRESSGGESSAKAPVINLEKTIEEKAPRLINLAKPAVISLKKNNLTDVKARVAFVLDCSGSMTTQFSSGNVQAVLDRIAVLAVQFDDDMALDLWAFADNFKKYDDVTLENLDDYIEKLTKKESRGFFSRAFSGIVPELGIGNNEPPVMTDVVNFYANSDTPAYVIFITDGGVYKNQEIESIVRGSASKPLFWQFVGLGGSNYGVLEKLDDMTGRMVDNADFFAIDDFRKVDDSELYDRLLNEFPGWLRQAKSKNII